MRSTLCVMFFSLAAAMASSLTVTPTTDTAALAAALGSGGGLTVNSVAILNGADQQFGTYTGFNSPPVTIGDGVVLSTGQVADVLPGSDADSDLGQPGTAEFDAYGPGRITNFTSSNDVAALQVNFTLAAPSQVGFKFVFGSIEFPVYTSEFTDAFLVFLDGTDASNQIVFDASGNPVQVGASFANVLTTADTNTVFSDPHGLLSLQTFTGNKVAAGNHSMIFEVGDVNDHALDSAVFIQGFGAGQGTGGTTPASTVPEPATFALLGFGFAAFAFKRWRQLMK